MESNPDKLSEVFEVEKIVSKILIDEKNYYFIKYVGYDQLVCCSLIKNKITVELVYIINKVLFFFTRITPY